MTQALKNSNSTSVKTFDIIQKTLIQHKAQHITLEYDLKETGKVRAIEFTINVNGTPFPFRLPARVENVEKIMYPGKRLTQTMKDQAYRTAWANIRDWITAQCAMIDTGMVQPEEVFLPYMISNRGRTFYQEMADSQFLLNSGK